MVSTLFPGDTPDTSVTVQNFLAMFEVGPTSCDRDRWADAVPARRRARRGLLHGKRIQQAVKTGAKSEFLFGRNEIGGQRFHGWVDRLVAAETDDEFARRCSNRRGRVFQR